MIQPPQPVFDVLLSMAGPVSFSFNVDDAASPRATMKGAFETEVARGEDLASPGMVKRHNE